MLTSITTLHIEEIQADHIDGSKTGTDQMANAMPEGRREVGGRGGGGGGGGGYVITTSNRGSK